LESFFGDADLKYDIYIGGQARPIRQQGTLARMSLAYGINPNLSFGTTVRYLKTRVSSANQSAPILPSQYALDANLELLTLGLIVNWDLRDDTIYPTSGMLLNFEAIHGASVAGTDLRYSKAFVNFSHFLPLGERSVLASRLSSCTATDETPFFDQCSIGGTDNMRGFSATQFLDARLLSAQIEYRRELTGRIGAVVFAGAGMTGSDFGALRDGGVHSAAGLGLRIRISKKFPVDFSFDGSLNNDNERLLYIYVGQRF
jgi:outer membrane protein assembly factor BamA